MNQQRNSRDKGGTRVFCIKRTTVFALAFLLLLGTVGQVATAVSPASAAQLTAPAGKPSLEAMPAAPPPAAKVTFKEMGYGERTLVSPWGTTRYSFKLPDHWVVKEGSYADIDLSYSFTDLVEGKQEGAITFFGELSLYLDDQLLQVYTLNAAKLEHFRWRVNLPSQSLNEPPGAFHELRIDLDAWFLCNTPHKAYVTLYPESVLLVDYDLLPLKLDLTDYPRPFQQQSFEPDQVRFVLPAQPSEAELRAAAAMAAGLGSLTSNRMVISATTDVDWLRAVQGAEVRSDHLLVIGQPSRNQLTAWLAENMALPIPMRRRELALTTQGPSAVVPGDVFTYTITVTNTTAAPVSNLSVADQLPRRAGLVSCQPACAETGPEVSWKLASLSPGEAASMSLVLQFTDVEQLGLVFPVLENLVILSSEAKSPMNTSFLATPIGSAPSPKSQVPSGQDEYFFVQNEQPVPEGDGILEEVVSPWDSQKVILLVTGVNEAAVSKASQSLSLKAPFLGMNGPAVLVRQIQPSPSITKTVETTLTLTSLGFGDQTIYGTYNQEITYWFPVPLGWQLTNDAYLRLLFNHSQAIDDRTSTLTVLINDAPLTTVPLDQKNAEDGSLQLSLWNARIRPGATNKLSLQVAMRPTSYRCETVNPRQAWFKMWQDSLLYLDHKVQSASLDLRYFPLPFSTRSDLGNVLFALPPVPGLVEEEAMLRLAASLGDATRGAGFNLGVSLGLPPDAGKLKDYHLILIGRPTTNPFLRQINSRLPQPFVPGTDEVEHQTGKVLLRLPASIPLGYIQELASPWNEEQALVAVTGTKDEGIAWAAQVLAWQPWRLSGNLALAREGKTGQGAVEVQSIDTRGLTPSGLAAAVATAVPDLTSTSTITPAQGAGAASSSILTPSPVPPATVQKKAGLPSWVLVFAGLTGMAVIGILGVVIWRVQVRQWK